MKNQITQGDLEIRYELKRAHTQMNPDKIIESKSPNPLVRYLNARKDPFDYDIQIWTWDGKDWDVEDLSGDEFLESIKLEDK